MGEKAARTHHRHDEGTAKFLYDSWGLFDGRSSSLNGHQLVMAVKGPQSFRVQDLTTGKRHPDYGLDGEIIAEVREDTPKFGVWTSNARLIVAALEMFRLLKAIAELMLMAERDHFKRLAYRSCRSNMNITTPIRNPERMQGLKTKSWTMYNCTGDDMKKTSHFRRQQPADSRNSALSSDTSPKMEALQIQLWRQASPTHKMQMLAQLNASARALALAGLRSRYPQASETEMRRRLADLLLGKELARKVYGEISHAI